METTENYGQPIVSPGINLTMEAQVYLREAGRWAVFLGVMGFIGCGIIFIVAFFAGSMFSRMAELSNNQVAAALAGMGGLVTVFYILIDLIYFFFSLYLYQFGAKVKQGIMFADSIHLTGALGKLKSFFKLWGILTIIVISLYAIIIIGVIIVSIGAASMNS